MTCFLVYNILPTLSIFTGQLKKNSYFLNYKAIFVVLFWLWGFLRTWNSFLQIVFRFRPSKYPKMGAPSGFLALEGEENNFWVF